MPKLKESKVSARGYLVAVLLTVGVGLLLTLRLGGWFQRLSYDLPFLFQNSVPDEIVMVYFDRAGLANLGETANPFPPRELHARLLERCNADGARLVLFDLMFMRPLEGDPQFADAIRKGKTPVVLVREMLDRRREGFGMTEAGPLVSDLAEAATAVGVANLDPDREDRVIRRFFRRLGTQPSAPFAAAGLLGALPTNQSATDDVLWLNFYCRPGGLRMMNYDHVVAANALPPGFFRDKIVVVGRRDNPADQFLSPHRLWREPPAPGATFQAFGTLNLVRGDWLRRLPYVWEFAFIVVWGVIAGAGLLRFRPWNAALLSVLAFVALASISVSAQLKTHVWWPWLIPAVAQTGVAGLSSIGWQYVVEFRRRHRLRRAFAAYLSPVMADRIANSEFDLSLGGVEVEATVMFTDLEGFTQLSETLRPQELSQVLTNYFNRITRDIFEQDGTIIKYIGDAVLAAWGVPLAVSDHAERGVLAACGIAAANRTALDGRRLRTRIGINTGLVLAGNLGSDFRFDYTLIGDTMNFASRLEALNKQLGTTVLISEATRERLSNRFVIRPLGRFRVVGKQMPVAIHEVLGLDTGDVQRPEWVSEFAGALGQFHGRNFEEAERLFSRVEKLRGGQDGPSAFYRRELQRLRLVSPGPEWDGIMELLSK